MQMSEQSQAVLLLTAWLGKPGKGEAKPLAPREWGRFARWLKDQEQAPEALLRARDVSALLHGWNDRTIDALRIQQLLERGAVMGIALEKWERAGLWVITRSDPDYPSRLKRLLKTDAPPVLFGTGNRTLLDRGGIAVVGSRDITSEDLAFTEKLGEKIALGGKSVVSGGARGADEAAMLGALASEGTVIGVLADSLLRASNSATYRSALMDGNLVLISPFNPEAGFDVGNAMARNKYIYCLADAAVVISTSKSKGGTWSGAIENLKHGWIPLWIKSHTDHASGNAALVDQGAQWLPEYNLDFDALMQAPTTKATTEPNSLFDANLSDVNDSTPSLALESEVETTLPDRANASIVGQGSEAAITVEHNLEPHGNLDLYEHFLLKLATATREAPATVEALQNELDLVKAQLNEWLKRAVKEGRIEKSAKPVRYQVSRTNQLF
ncbi:MAG: DNA-protecting protein DprA [Xanthomonadales bacterium]|nr:DNA-protecting protein DprA [Xanthomonadales bacterium]